MSIVNLEVSGFGHNLKLKVHSNATRKSVKEILGLETIHENCGGRLSQSMSCKDCGESYPKTVLLDKETGVVLTKNETESGLQIVGRIPTKTVDYRWVEEVYLAEIPNDAPGTASLIEALRTEGTALLGYVRLRKNSPERPAALLSPEPGVLTLQLLYYSDSEATSGITVFENSKPAYINEALSEIQRLADVEMYDLEYRELYVTEKAILEASEGGKSLEHGK